MKIVGGEHKSRKLPCYGSAGPVGCLFMGKERQRIPPNQRVISTFPVLHIGPVPKFDAGSWDLLVEGLVENRIRLSYEQLLRLPKVVSVSDFHCVTGWSRLDNKWEGVEFKTIAGMARPLKNARNVMVVAEGDYATSLPLKILLDNDVLLAYRLDDKPLPPEHGGPLRLVVPKKYAYKSAKWVRKLRFTEHQELGYWEQRGYSNYANPWREERYS